MTALPPIGSRVRTMAGDVGIVDAYARIPIGGPWRASVRWRFWGGGRWVTADEIEEVLP